MSQRTRMERDLREAKKRGATPDEQLRIRGFYERVHQHHPPTDKRTVQHLRMQFAELIKKMAPKGKPAADPKTSNPGLTNSSHATRGG